MREKEGTTTMVTTKVQKNQTELYPIVGYFPSGFDSASQPPPHRINVLRHEKHNKRLQIVVSPDEDSIVDFVGTSFSGEGATPQLCNFVVGVFDKDASTLKFVPLPANKIFRLEPKIAGLDVSEMEFSKETNSAINDFSGNKAVRQDEEERKKLACIFSYITHLIKFKDEHSMDGVASAKHHRVPGIIRQKFLNMFALSDNKRLPEQKKSLLINYILVLTLFVDEFDMNPSDIAKDLRMSEIKIRPYLEHLGCEMHKRQRILKFELKVPLEFTKRKFKRNKR